MFFENRDFQVHCYDYFADFKEILVKSEARFGISVSIYPEKPSPYVVLSLFSVSAKSRMPGFHHLYVPTDHMRFAWEKNRVALRKERL